MKIKPLIIPTKSNNFTPKLLQKAALLMMTMLVLLSFAAVNIQTLLWQSSDWLVGTVLPAVVVDLTNDQRVSLNEPILHRSSVLDEAAQAKAEHMAKNHYFAHYSPDGVSPWYWFEKAGYVYAHAGENLAIHFSDSGAVVDAWMNSPAHRANIANANYTEIGIGTAKGTFDGFETVFVVQLFGTPAAKPVVAPAPKPVVVAEAVVPPPPSVPVPAAQLAFTEQAPLSEEKDLQQVAGESSEVEVAPVVKEAPIKVEEPEVAISDEESLVDVEDVVSSEDGTSVFSTHFATSSGLAPLYADVNMSGSTVTKYSIVEAMATRPNTILQTIYLIIGIIVASLLFTSILLSVRQHSPRHIAFGVMLLVLMSALFYVHMSLTSNVVIASELEAVTKQQAI